MKLSIVIPAHNEGDSISETLRELHRIVVQNNIPHEILVVNDNSRDHTHEVLEGLKGEIGTLRTIFNPSPNGFGLAVRKGLENIQGDAAVIVMADGSDSPHDVVRFYRKMLEGYDCVFGSRFISNSKVKDYPFLKLRLNRVFNHMIRALFGLKYNDVTNAFKMYRADVLHGLKPFLSHHFNLTVELPLKAIIRGYSYAVLPNSWQNRKSGESKLKIKEMGSRYLFIVMYCFIEKWLCSQDYLKKNESIHLNGRNP